MQRFCFKPERIRMIYMKYIYRASITIKGVKYYAKDYGKKAFKIPV